MKIVKILFSFFKFFILKFFYRFFKKNDKSIDVTLVKSKINYVKLFLVFKSRYSRLLSTKKKFIKVPTIQL